MKLLRFFKNIALFLYNEWAGPVLLTFVIYGILWIVICGILWIVGWIGLLLGIPSPTNAQHPELAIGYSIIVFLGLLTVSVMMIRKFISWIRDIWKDS